MNFPSLFSVFNFLKFISQMSMLFPSQVHALKVDLKALQALLAGLAPEASPGDLLAVRLEHGRPRYGDDITERYIAHETGQMHALNFQKGCYLGQEIVERVRSRGLVNRPRRQRAGEI